MSAPVPPNFVIGVFSQPTSSFAKWKARGINTLVSHEPEGGSIPKLKWENAAEAAGLFFMDYPDFSTPTMQSIESRQAYRLAWMQDDEPDLNRGADKPGNIPGGPYRGWRVPDPYVTRYKACKAAAPNMPVFCNFQGPAITPLAYTHGNGHKPYLAACDWDGHDWYVKNKNAARYPVELIGQAMDRLKLWGGGHPQFAFVECSDQNVAPDTIGRAPTPDEMQAEVDMAIAHGAKGIIYFPQRPPPGFAFDAMPPELVDRMIAVNAALKVKFDPAPVVVLPPPPPHVDPTPPLIPPAVLPTPNIAPGRVVRVYCITNPTPVFELNPDFGGSPDAFAQADARGRPKWIRTFRANQYARDLGLTPMMFVGNGTLNDAGRWCDIYGNLRAEDSAGTLGTGNYSLPPTRTAVQAVTLLARKADFYGDKHPTFGSQDLRPMFVDIENDGGAWSYQPAAPLAQRRACLTNVLNTVTWMRQISRNTIPVYVPYLFPIAADEWGDTVETSDVDDLLRQIRKQIAGACVPASNGDLSLASDGRGWFAAMRQVDVLISRQTPEFARSKLAVVSPIWWALGPEEELVKPYAGLAGKPVDLPLFKDQCDWLVDNGYDLVAWCEAEPAESVRGHLEYLRALAR